MERKKILYTATLVSALVLALLFTYKVPEPEWGKERISESVDQRFFDVESSDGTVYVAYRNSTDGGVRVASRSAANLFSSVSGWSSETVSDVPGSGAYLSLEMVEGEPAVAYQVAETGNERVVYAERNGGNWSVEQVEGVTGGGVNVGMYTSLTSWKGKPLLFYHSPTRGLKSALKTEEGWEKHEFGKELGWFTATASCGEEAFAAFRGRESKQLRLATYDGSWNVENISGKVKSSISLTQEGCEPAVSYLGQDEVLKYYSGGKTRNITQSSYSDVSVEGEKVSFYRYGEGVYFGSWNGTSWEKEELRRYQNASRYNRFESDSAGNLHVLYVNDGALVHEEMNAGTLGKKKKALNGLRIAFGVLLALLAVLSVRELDPENLNRITGDEEDEEGAEEQD
ncbi:MAG: hypothetical protein ABEJ03_03545 [Candidatus Nanohaloarchaea archaeon]